MKITVTVKPNARKNEVIALPDGTFKVSVTAPPADGKANEKVIELLSEYFKRPKSGISIVRGTSARLKRVEIT